MGIHSISDSTYPVSVESAYFCDGERIGTPGGWALPANGAPSTHSFKPAHPS